MQFTRLNPMNNELVTRDLPVTEEQHQAWMNGKLIQHAMPHLSPGDREWLISGMLEEDFDRLCKEGPIIKL